MVMLDGRPAGAAAGRTPLWPTAPEPIPVGSGSREDRLRMLRAMRAYWHQVNAERSQRVRRELAAARECQAQVGAYWDEHKRAVVDVWAEHRLGRGRTMVCDISLVAAQWDPANPFSPDEVVATKQARGIESPFRWRCPLFPDEHPAWAAWPKDRVQKGAGCPACRKLGRLADLPSLAVQYAGAEPAEEISYAAHAKVPWVCRTWALDPATGRWQQVEHHFHAEIKSRALQQDACLVCAGYLVDDTTSLLRWFPDLAAELDDPALDAAKMSTTAHNASRRECRDGKNAYLTVPWMCRHGHAWEATVLNRVQGGNCPRCSTAGISKEQVRLAAELAFLFPFLPPGDRDPRLSEDTPDFASHQLTIPDALKPADWRYRAVEVDFLLRLPCHKVTVGVEYDGAYHHSAESRARTGRRDEREKSEVLAAAGLLDLLVHVRSGELEVLEGEHLLSVAVPEHAGPFQQASAVAQALTTRYPGCCLSLADYLHQGCPRAQLAADAYIMAVWGELKAPRRPRPRTTPKPRALKATASHPSSWLTPVGEPFRDPDAPRTIVRRYRCRCSNEVVRVQADVTRGNTTSCGCRRPSPPVPAQAPAPAENSEDVRAWARQHGHPVGTAGRLPGPLLAAYRAHQAGRVDLLGPDGLLPHQAVQDWAARHGQLSARGRLPGDAWLHYINALLEQPPAS